MTQKISDRLCLPEVNEEFDMKNVTERKERDARFVEAVCPELADLYRQDVRYFQVQHVRFGSYVQDSQRVRTMSAVVVPARWDSVSGRLVNIVGMPEEVLHLWHDEVKTLVDFWWAAACAAKEKRNASTCYFYVAWCENTQRIFRFEQGSLPKDWTIEMVEAYLRRPRLMKKAVVDSEPVEQVVSDENGCLII